MSISQPVKQHPLLTILLLLISATTMAQSLTQTIRGQVIDKQTQGVLIGATVRLEQSDKGAVTDDNGYFRIDGVPVGRVTLHITYLGYETMTLSNLDLSSGKELVLTIEMEEKVLEAQEVVVSAAKDKITPNNDMATVSARQFTVEETE